MTHDEERIRGYGDVELYGQRWRPDAGEPRATMAVVHGFGEHSGRYENVVNRLVPAGYAVYAFDLRGHGRSPGQRGHVDRWTEYREDVGAFVRHAAAGEPGRPFFLMGHSMGGLIVLEYAEQHPEGLRGVVASGPLLATPGISPVKLALGRMISRVYPRFSLDAGLDVTAISRDPAVVAAYRKDPLVHSRGTARLSTEIAAAQARTLAGAANWTLPLLIIHGAADRLAPAVGSRAFFERVPASVDKERDEIPDGAHEPHNDTSQQQALDILQGWLDRHV
ncbi:MAG TPA: lysophospholipase [Ktedonobacterales bacterium]|jgi:alpha-beta hydrolase superfamily lysophospholipase